MVGAIAIFCFYHPGRYLGPKAASSRGPKIEDGVELTGGQKRSHRRLRSVV